ncbi:MAG: DUF3857 domain-containing protein, partial [Cyclobacteriaceae bacterium]
NQITEEEWAIDSYDEDPEAEAIILFDKGETRFIESDGGYKMRFTRHKRIKILDKKGEKYANIAILQRYISPSRREEITSLKAYTYNLIDGALDGKKVPEALIFEETYEDRFKRTTFTFPAIQEGSIIEFEYVLESPFFFFLPDWDFQESIPVLYSEYVVRTIPFYEYVFIAQGIKEFDYYDSSVAEKKRKYPGTAVTDNFGRKAEFQDVVNTYVMTDQPAFKDESFITSRNHYIRKIDFQLSKVHSPYTGTTKYMTTWPKLVEDMLEQDGFGKYLRQSEVLGRKILKSDLLIEGKEAATGAEEIIEYVKDNFSWSGRYGVESKNTARQFVSRREGNMAEINLFLCGLLRAAGYDANPVFLSTRKHGKVYRKYPFLHYFNAVVVIVSFDGRSFLTDATQGQIPFDMIPPNCINEYGLVAKEEDSGWVNLMENNMSETSYTSQIRIDTGEMIASATLSITASVLDAYNYRTTIGDDDEAFEDFLLKNGYSDVESTKLIRIDEVSRPIMMAAKTSMDLETIGDRIILVPFAGFPMNENLLKQNERNYPIDFTYPKTRHFTSMIDIPEGYEINNTPENYVFADDLVDISLTYMISKSQLTIKGHYQFKKGIYPAEEYQLLKKHLGSITDRFNRSIIFKRAQDK